MAIIYQCDLCDEPASVEVALTVKTVKGTPCRSVSKHLCGIHSSLVREFELRLIRTSSPATLTAVEGREDE